MRRNLPSRLKGLLAALHICAAALLLVTGPLAALLVPGPASADPLPALKAAPNEPQRPGDAGWEPGARVEHGVDVDVAAAPKPILKNAPGDVPGNASGDAPDYVGNGDQLFRVTLRPQKNAAAESRAAPRACAGLTSALRRNLHKTRAIALEIRASRPVAGLAVITSANTERPGERDRHFGSFVIGADWKALRLVYGDLAPLPGWAAEAARLGFAPGDLVLRPDSVEDICIGTEAGRLPEEGVTLFIRNLRFTP